MGWSQGQFHNKGRCPCQGSVLVWMTCPDLSSPDGWLLSPRDTKWGSQKPEDLGSPPLPSLHSLTEFILCLCLSHTASLHKPIQVPTTNEAPSQCPGFR